MTFRRALAIAVALALLLAPTASQGAGTVVITEETFGSPRKVTFAWTSTAGGAADAQTTEAFSGKIEALVTDPDGTAAPTDDYDVTVTDEDGTDVLAAAGANRDTANTELVLSASLGIVANDKLTVNITNAGAAKAGLVILYIR